MIEMICKFKEIIKNSENAVFFGGAGVSVPSGIPDFRSNTGLYGRKYPYPPETMLSRDFFFENTGMFYDFYINNMLYPNAKPNVVHKKLAKLEPIKAVVTQNIDGLHQEGGFGLSKRSGTNRNADQDAGSGEVLELHGSVRRNYCLSCGKFYGLEYILNADGVPKCACGGIVKPDVVLYGEGLDGDVVSRAVSRIQKADTLIIGGTSLVVYPAAGMVRYFRGKNLVVVNKTPTNEDKNAALVINGDIAEVFAAP